MDKALNQRRLNVGRHVRRGCGIIRPADTHIKPALGQSRQTRDIEPIVVQCRADVADGGPTFTQHWFNVSRLLICPLFPTQDVDSMSL